MKRVFNVSIDFEAEEDFNEEELQAALKVCFAKLNYPVMGIAREYSWSLSEYVGGIKEV